MFPLPKNHDAMNKLRITVAMILATAASCVLLDPELQLGSVRDPYRSGEGGTEEGGEGGAGTKADTVFTVSAVCFPREYDWQRDSSYGEVACTLRLYRSERMLVEVPAGPGTYADGAADRHHILDGRLYSEICDSRGTIVSCDGNPAARWKEAERLLGLVVSEGSIFTLSRPAGKEDGFVYRRNGEVLMKLDSGTPFGGFGHNGYGPGGALYQDEGKVCFAYSVRSAWMTSVYGVCDGVAETLLRSPSAKPLDAKYIKGKPAVLYNDGGVTVLSCEGRDIDIGQGGSLFWDNGSLLLFEGRVSVMGSWQFTGGGKRAAGIGWENSGLVWENGADYIYSDGESCDHLEPSDLRLRGCYFPWRECGKLAGGKLALALTPLDTGSSPYLAFGRDTLRYPVCGFLSGVEVSVRK